MDGVGGIVPMMLSSFDNFLARYRERECVVRGRRADAQSYSSLGSNLPFVPPSFQQSAPLVRVSHQSVLCVGALIRKKKFRVDMKK
jgi:hypothetical protein